MNAKVLFGLMMVSILGGQILFAQDQRRDKGVMVEYKNEFMDSIRQGFNFYPATARKHRVISVCPGCGSGTFAG